MGEDRKVVLMSEARARIEKRMSDLMTTQKGPMTMVGAERVSATEELERFCDTLVTVEHALEAKKKENEDLKQNAEILLEANRALRRQLEALGKDRG